MNNSESNMNGEEHGKEQEQTKEEEQEDPIKQTMLQRAGLLRSKWRRWRDTDNPSKDMPRADKINFCPQVGSQENA